MKEWQRELQKALDGIIVDLSEQCPNTTREEILTQSAKVVLQYLVFGREDFQQLLEEIVDQYCEMKVEEKSSGSSDLMEETPNEEGMILNHSLLQKEVEFGFKSDLGIGQRIEISITRQEDAIKDEGTLVLLSMIKKGENDKNFVKSLVWGTGTMEDLIELGCKSSKFAMEQAVQKYHQLDGDFPPHQLQLQLSQIALQSLMNDKLGRIDIGIEKIIESLLDRLTIQALAERVAEDERHDDE